MQGEVKKHLECWEQNVWVPQDQVENVEDAAEKFLVGQFKLVYLKGKGKKFVPVLVPKVPKIRLLIQYWTLYGISAENPFLFATKSGKSHCSGWHALKNVCSRADVSMVINAGKMRHRLSTIYASLPMLPQKQDTFLDQIGHGKTTISTQLDFACNGTHADWCRWRYLKSLFKMNAINIKWYIFKPKPQLLSFWYPLQHLVFNSPEPKWAFLNCPAN